MKKLVFFFTVLFAALYSNAQNVAINNDGTSAATSAMLDVKSTTKGMLTPRMTSAQRIAIASPALGLLVFDTDTKTLWAYDGASWKNLYTSGGGLTLPFSQTVNTGTSALQITNSGTGAAIEGISSAQFGTGMTAKATGEASWGLYAYTNGIGSKSVNAYAQNGIAFYGENNAVSTNTLMSLLNFGTAKTATFQLSNTGSTDANVQIAGNHLGHQLKIYQTNAANSQAAVSIENSGTGTGIEAISTTGYGIKGITNTPSGFAGVYGQNTGAAGSGVIGTSNAAGTQGVYGSSTNGIAVRALSTNGTALSVEGNVKIAGGNTNPSSGAVLTSDAQGNAVWKNSKVAFRAQGSDATYGVNLLPNQDYTVIYNNESYDYGNNFAVNDPVNNIYSALVVPVNGVYNFGANLTLIVNDADEGDNFDARIKFAVLHNNSLSFHEEFHPYNIGYNPASTPQIIADFKISTELHLSAGDKVFVIIYHYNTNNAKADIAGGNNHTYFHGRLVIAD